MSWEFARPALLATAIIFGLATLAWGRSRGYYTRARLAGLTAARCLTIIALALAAGGLSWRAAGRGLNLVAVVDESSSVAPSRRATVAGMLAGIRAGLPPGGRFTVVRFAGTTSVEPGLPPGTATGAFPGLQTSRTDIERAMRVALTRVVPGADNRVLLLSDGQETAGSALRVLPDYARADASIWAVDLSGVRRAAVDLRAASAPQHLRTGEPFAVKGVLASGGPLQVSVTLWRDGSPAGTAEVVFEAAEEKEVAFPQEAGPPGLVKYRLQIDPPQGVEALSASREIDVLIEAPPPLLYLADDPDAARLLGENLTRSGFRAAPLTPAAWQEAGAAGPAGGVMILDDVAAPSLGTSGMERIERLVREQGLGLLVIGGRHSLGAGGFKDTQLERLLPVVMGAPGKGPEAEIGLVLVVDASFSMYYRGRSGNLVRGTSPRKIEIARAAVIEVLRALRPRDQVGILESKDKLYWIMRPGLLTAPADIEKKVSEIRAIGGGINFYSSVLEAAAALRGVSTPIKVIMVLCDTADIDQYRVESAGESSELARRLGQEGIPISIFAIGYPTDKDVPFLKSMAALSRGDFFLVSDIIGLPRYLRAEYEKKAGEWFKEGRFHPVVKERTAVLDRISDSDLPAIGGVNLLSTKGGAEEFLTTELGSPLLATWSYGRGKAAVFAADSGARWGEGWVSWPDAGRFWRQLIYRLAPRPGRRGIEVRAKADRESGKIRLKLQEEDGRFVERGALSLWFEGVVESPERPLKRTGLDDYETSLPVAPAAERYRFSIGRAGGKDEALATGSVEVATPPETRIGSDGGALIRRLVRAGGGKLAVTPADVLPPSPVADRWRPEPIFPLLAVALLGMLLEFVLRRE